MSEESSNFLENITEQYYNELYHYVHFDSFENKYTKRIYNKYFDIIQREQIKALKALFIYCQLLLVRTTGQIACQKNKNFEFKIFQK